MQVPVGMLSSTGICRFLDRDMVREIATDNWSPAMPQAEELALAEYLDEAGANWTLVIDGAVWRAAMPIPPDYRYGTPMTLQKHWWVETLSPDHVLLRMRGWLDDWRASGINE
jgi:hypothetical protein